MSLSDQYIDSYSDDDSQDDSYSDYSTKTKTTRKRASTSNKKANKIKATPKRPGRKPIEKSMDEELAGGDPKLKRKAQNRAAQRAFRNRKEKFVSELQERIRQLEEEKSSKEADLEVENAKLKEELDKLRQENHSLKDAKFTFEYPNTTNNTCLNDEITPRPLDSPPLSSTNEDYNSNSDHVQKSSLSKHININSKENTNNSSSSGSEHNSPSNILNQSLGVNQPSKNHTSVIPFGLLNDLETNYVNAPSSNSDLFHGKMDFAFTNYRNPVTPADDWLLRENSSLPPLFGVDADRYGFNQPPPASVEPSFYNNSDNTIDSMNNYNSIYNSIYSSLNTSYTLQPQRQTNYYNPDLTLFKVKVLETIRIAKEQGKTRLQVKSAVESSCPGFNVEMLCGELRRMTVGYDSSQPFNDTDLAICASKLV